MSDTPRTDALEDTFEGYEVIECYKIMAGHARALELESAEASGKVTELENELFEMQTDRAAMRLEIEGLRYDLQRVT